MIRKTTMAALAFTSLVPAVALADEAPALHDFATLDRASGQTGAGADLSIVTGDFGDDVSGAVSRLDLHGEYVHASGFGAYGSFAVSKAFLDSSDPFAEMANDATAMSNLELGGQYRRALSSELDLVAHVGLALPTAQNDDLGAIITSSLSMPRRLNDLVTAVPDLTTLRIGVSPTWHEGALFLRADVGADIALDEAEGMDMDPLMHANLAAGMRRGKFSGAVELVTIATTGDVGEGEDRYVHTAGLSLAYDLGRVSPSLTVVAPIDDAVGGGDVFAIGAGVGATF
jgi:hypothetical protein